MPYSILLRMNYEAKYCNYSLKRGKKTAPVLNSREDRSMRKGKYMDENKKDLIRNGQNPEDFIPEEEPGSGELTEEELREYEKKEKRDNAIISDRKSVV